jgi:hypothetical protein
MIYIKKNTTQKYKDRATQNPPKPVVNNGLEGASSSCSTCGTGPVTLVTKSHESRKDWIIILTNRTYPLSFVTQIYQVMMATYNLRIIDFNLTTRNP